MESTNPTLERRLPSERRTVMPSLTVGGYRISWGAVWAGVIAGVGIQLIFGILGVGVGASTINPAAQSNSLSGLGTGAAIWLFVSTLISYYISGLFAGRMSGAPTKKDGALHGLVMFSLSLVIMAFLLTSTIGGLFAGAGSLFGKQIGATALRDQIGRGAIGDGVSTAAIFSVVVLLCAAAMSALGGAIAVPRLVRFRKTNPPQPDLLA